METGTRKVTHFFAVPDARKQTAICYAVLDDGSLWVSAGEDARSDWEELMPVPGTARRLLLDGGGA